MNKKLAIIGVGNMGGALYKRLACAMPKEHIALCDTDAKKLARLSAYRSFTSAQEAALSAKCVILAVKPQAFHALAKDLFGSLEKKLVISIMAGISLASLSKTLGAKKIIRAMPNLAIQEGAGVIGWIASSFVTKEENALARKLFSPLGHEIEVKKEEMIDSITALSGSGPAYFFYLVNLLETKARAMGFSESSARIISEHTLIGSAKLLESGKKSAEEWREAVTSKGGTTSAALSHLKEHGFDMLFYEAIDTAKKRAKELQK